MSTPRRLGAGRCFGSIRRRVDTGAFSLALMHPDPELEVELHTHEAAHLIVHLGGTYLSTARGAPARADGLLVVCNPPGVTHRDRYQRTGRRVEGCFLNIGIAAETWAALRPAGEVTEARCLTSPAVHARVVELLRAWVTGSPDTSTLDDTCTELLGALHVHRPPSRTPPPWLARARELLRDTTPPAGIAEVARSCGVHPVALARTFRRWEGMNPAAFARQERLHRAVAQLSRGEPPSMVAAHQAYADQSHLTHDMRTALGITPAAWQSLVGSLRR